jgi:hypothetical protein
MANFRKFALQYASFGWKVLPLAPGRKVTLIPRDADKAARIGFKRPGRGVHDATDNADIIEEWADVCADANVGIATGRCSGSNFGLDIDTRVPGAGDLWESLIRRHGQLPRAPLVSTRSGGWHLYFDGRDAPQDFKKKLMKLVPSEEGSLKSIATGLEVKWTGGYLVAPPSYIAPGAEPDGICGYYTWVRPPVGPNLPKVPKWLWGVFQLKPRPKSTCSQFLRYRDGSEPKKLARLVKEVEANGPGSANRDSIFFWAAQRAADEVMQGYYSARSAYDALFAAGLEIGQQPFEVRRALRDLGKLCRG